MSEEQQPAETEGQQQEVQDENQEKAPKPSETVDFWKQKAREQEKRAKANSDAATELEQIRESQKSESEKSAEKIRQLQSEVESQKVEALRFKVASQYGINDEDAQLFLTGPDEDTLQRQAQRLGKRDEDAGKPRAPKPDPNQGRDGGNPGSVADQFAAAMGDLL